MLNQVVSELSTIFIYNFYAWFSSISLITYADDTQ